MAEYVLTTPPPTAPGTAANTPIATNANTPIASPRNRYRRQSSGSSDRIASHSQGQSPIVSLTNSASQSPRTPSSQSGGRKSKSKSGGSCCDGANDVEEEVHVKRGDDGLETMIVARMLGLELEK